MQRLQQVMAAAQPLLLLHNSDTAGVAMAAAVASAPGSAQQQDDSRSGGSTAGGGTQLAAPHLVEASHQELQQGTAPWRCRLLHVAQLLQAAEARLGQPAAAAVSAPNSTPTAAAATGASIVSSSMAAPTGAEDADEKAPWPAAAGGVPLGGNLTAPDGMGHRWCYLLFTSGSTGAPLGVCGTEQGLLNRCWWQQHRTQAPTSTGSMKVEPATPEAHSPAAAAAAASGQAPPPGPPGASNSSAVTCPAAASSMSQLQQGNGHTLALGPGSVIAFSTATVFVDHLWQMFGPLLSGQPVKVVVLPEGWAQAVTRVLPVLQQQGVTHLVRKEGGGAAHGMLTTISQVHVHQILLIVTMTAGA